jgi:hypothetical protein
MVPGLHHSPYGIKAYNRDPITQIRRSRGHADPVTSKDPYGLVDYYALLGVRPGFSDLALLRSFLRKCRSAMATGDMEGLQLIRRGFEVLRYEDTRIKYFRMHRVLVKREALRFPEVKKREMMDDIREKEALAENGTSPVLKPGMNYSMLLSIVLIRIAWLDLSRIIPWCLSGLVLCTGIMILVAVNGLTWFTLGASAFVLIIAFYALRLRASDYVTYPEHLS